MLFHLPASISASTFRTLVVQKECATQRIIGGELETSVNTNFCWELANAFSILGLSLKPFPQNEGVVLVVLSVIVLEFLILKSLGSWKNSNYFSQGLRLGRKKA